MLAGWPKPTPSVHSRLWRRRDAAQKAGEIAAGRQIVPLRPDLGARGRLNCLSSEPVPVPSMSGLIVSQALTLFTTPVIYIYLDQLSDWISSWRSPVRNPQPQPLETFTRERHT
jgi:hypothetical protein